jgi:HTH-type transcriptional regulator/antitoxin HigA
MSNFKVTNRKGNELHADVLLHPGEVIAEELEARNIKKTDFASKLGIQPANLSEMLKGKRNLSALTAFKLEQLLGISAEFWLRLQMDYDLQIVRRNHKNAA